MKIFHRFLPLAGVLSTLFLATALPAHALDNLRAGKAVAADWAFLPLDVGKEAGIYEKYGINLDIVAFAGDAKLIQGFDADSVDVGFG